MNKNVALVEEIIIALLVLVIAVTSYYIFSGRRHIVYSEPVPVADLPINMPEPISPPPSSPSDVFASTPQTNTSSVVGYFASGAFVTELPDWIAENWISPKSAENSTIFTPREIIADRDFSDITIVSGDTNEIYNAEYLFENNKAHARGEGKLVNSEIILNESSDMRIYHIERSLMGTIYSLYYIDGNGKTAEISFSAEETNYFTYSSKIKEFIRGLSKGSEPRG